MMNDRRALHVLLAPRALGALLRGRPLDMLGSTARRAEGTLGSLRIHRSLGSLLGKGPLRTLGRLVLLGNRRLCTLKRLLHSRLPRRTARCRLRCTGLGRRFSLIATRVADRTRSQILFIFHDFLGLTGDIAFSAARPVLFLTHMIASFFSGFAVSSLNSK